VEAEKIILIYLTVPALVFIILLIMVELKIFHMAVVIVLAAIAALFEKLDKKYDKAKQEINDPQF
jgi:cell division protein FtsL